MSPLLSPSPPEESGLWPELNEAMNRELRTDSGLTGYHDCERVQTRQECPAPGE